MRIQVNLLDEAEVREVGRVSRQFIGLVASATIVLLLIFVVFFTSWRLNSLEGRLAEAKAQLEAQEVAYKQALASKADLTWRSDALAELASWQETAIDLPAFLSALAKVVPKDVQLVNLDFKSKLVSGRPVGSSSIQRLRKCGVKFEGKSVGDLADLVVLDFVRSLQEDKALKGVMTKVQLQRMQNSSGDNAAAVRAFSIGCSMEDKVWR